MVENTDNPNPSPESLERGYEVGDVSIRAAAWFLPIFALFVVVSLVFLWFVHKQLLKTPTTDDRPRSIIQDPQRLSTAAPLQPSQIHDRTPREDLKLMYRDENQVFNQLGWKVDEKSLMPQPPDGLIDQVISRTNARVKPIQPATEGKGPTGNTVTPIPQRDQGGRQ